MIRNFSPGRAKLAAPQCAAMIALLWLSPLQAWNDFGHMTVAYVAYQKLGTKTRMRVDQLLMANPYFMSKWPAKIPMKTAAADRPAFLFMLAATWPDAIKRDNDYHNDGASNGDRPTGPEANRNTGYDDFNRHKYWHFLDQPFTQDGASPLPPAPAPNAKTQIDAFRAVLRSDDPDPKKSYDLVWLLHLIGDVHQPLHGATRVSKASPEGDAGGNGVAFCPVGAKNCTKAELHAFWDDILGTSESLETAKSFAKGIAAPEVSAADIADSQKWLDESLMLAKAEVYKKPVGAGNGPFNATKGYTNNAKKVAARRVALAGARLAAVLNADLK